MLLDPDRHKSPGAIFGQDSLNSSTSQWALLYNLVPLASPPFRVLPRVSTLGYPSFRYSHPHTPNVDQHGSTNGSHTQSQKVKPCSLTPETRLCKGYEIQSVCQCLNHHSCPSAHTRSPWNFDCLATRNLRMNRTTKWTRLQIRH